MKYDHIIKASENLVRKQFHLSCGFYENTVFFFEQANFAVNIHCKGTLTFYSAGGQKLNTVKARPMQSGRWCYMDVLVTTTENEVVFQLPEYVWTDHYPNCDGESDRWDAQIIGIRDEIRYPSL